MKARILVTHFFYLCKIVSFKVSMLNLLYVLLCCHLLTSRMKNTESKFSQGVSLYFVCVNGNALCLLFLVQLSLRVIFGDDCSKVGITENALCSFVHTLHTVTG